MNCNTELIINEIYLLSKTVNILLLLFIIYLIANY